MTCEVYLNSKKVLKSAVTTWIGMYTFGGVTPTTFFLLGQMINFTGGVMYTLVKACEQNSQETGIFQAQYLVERDL